MRVAALAACLCLLLACGEQPNPAPPPKPAPAPAGHGDEHGERHDLGEVVLGSHRFRVFQVQPIVAGAECDFDLDFAGSGELPVVRGWIGSEDASGSMKVQFHKETPTRMHGHPPAPEPLADDAKLWLSIDGAGKASVALRR